MALARNTNPLKAPWPPDVDFRIINDPKLGEIGQLRPGATLPRDVYHKLKRDVCRRFSTLCDACHPN